MLKLICISVIKFYFKLFNVIFNNNKTFNIYSKDENFINYVTSKIVDYSQNQKTIVINRNLCVFNYFFKTNIIIESELVTSTKRTILSLNKNNFFISFHNDPWISWNISDILNKNNSVDIDNISLNSKNIIDKFILCSNKKQKDKILVLGTGPSISSIDFAKYNDFLSIVCNTFVINKDAFKQLKPDFLVATDAAVYLGNSLTSKLFYFELNLRLKEIDFLFVYPASLHLVVMKNVDKEFHKNLIPISNSLNESFLTIVNEFKISSLGNTFNSIMMPLACYISKEIYLAGFDGVAKKNTFKENSAIWKHNQNFSFGNLLSDLNKTEVSFQNFHKYLNDNDLYEKEYFGEKLEKQIVEIEQFGYRVINLTDSNHFSLKKRYLNK